MKILYMFLSIIWIQSVSGQEKLNTFHVVDAESKAAVQRVSITILRAKLSITTEKDGIFSIPGELAVMKDTVILFVQNYDVFKIPIHKLSNMDTIALLKSPIKVDSLKREFKDDTLLNDFKRKDIVYFAGLHSETKRFEYLQLAQEFNVEKTGVLLKNITISRLAFVLESGSYSQLGGMENTTFRVRIYSRDPVTGGPGKDLCNRIIEAGSKTSSQIKVNLSDYSIIIPEKTFFVAIEWLRDYYNMGYGFVYDDKLDRPVQIANYRPAIGISPVKNNKLHIWGLNFKQTWDPYTYFSPFGTDLAIKAVVKKNSSSLVNIAN